ncbi:MAG: methionyl-tRNA formyltransferase [Mariprofundaceae bacterium]|nr:methionyl-tRNA formyltransferase [Mariprofundaceae bacterium]
MIRVVFAGTPVFSVSCLHALMQAAGVEVVGVVSQPDRRAGRGMKLTPSAVKKAALDAGIDVITPRSLRDNDEALAWLKSKQADLLVVVAFGMILPKPWLDAPKVAPINVHASLLPRWRGAAPIERALLAGDSETGVGIMQMEEGLDTGGVYAEARVPITHATTGSGLWSELSDTGAKLLVDALPGIVSGDLKPVPQDESQVTYAKKLSNEERVVDWTHSATSVDRTVRCFSPKPGARAMFRGKWLKIIRGEAVEGSTNQPPGVVVGDKSLDIACGDGSIYRICEVQPEGKNSMGADAFLRGTKLNRGELLSGSGNP